ncbi:MAG: type II secretion system F family protein [Acidimicrobiia bacterium]
MIRLVPAVVAATLLALRAPVGAVLVAAAFVLSPLVAFAALGVVITSRVVQSRRRSHDEDAVQRLLRDLSAGVRAGADLRTAVASSPSTLVDRSTRRLCELGAPMRDVAASLMPHLRTTGREFIAVASVSEEAGSSIGPALLMLAHQASDQRQQRRDAGVALAQAKFSAIVVGVLPLAIGVAIVLLRGVPEPGGAPVVVPMLLGSLMMVVGATVVLAVTKRVSRW